MYKFNNDKIQKKKFSRDFEDAENLEFIWYVNIEIKNSLRRTLEPLLTIK